MAGALRGQMGDSSSMMPTQEPAWDPLQAGDGQGQGAEGCWCWGEFWVAIFTHVHWGPEDSSVAGHPKALWPVAKPVAKLLIKWLNCVCVCVSEVGGGALGKWSVL